MLQRGLVLRALNFNERVTRKYNVSPFIFKWNIMIINSGISIYFHLICFISVLLNLAHLCNRIFISLHFGAKQFFSRPLPGISLFHPSKNSDLYGGNSFPFPMPSMVWLFLLLWQICIHVLIYLYIWLFATTYCTHCNWTMH